MAIELSEFEGNVNIGLYVVPSDSMFIAPETLPKKFIDALERVLKVDSYLLPIDPQIIGALIKMNKSGLLLSSLISTTIEAKLKDMFPDMRVQRFDFNYFALGNLILTSKKTTLVSPIIPKSSQTMIEETFDTEVIPLKLNDSDLLGSLVVTNEVGGVASPLIENEDELDNLQDLLGLNSMRVSTVNRGADFPSSGIICNSFGALLGKDSTGLEQIAISNGLFPS